ncbi:MAG TPA: hypothetical protein VF954_07760 [Acidimicrobiales bacterium]
MKAVPLKGQLVRPDDTGQVGGVEALAFGVLIFVLGTLVVANAWGVIDAKMAAAGAAREATRAFVEAPTPDAAGALAEAAAADAIAAQGRNPARMHLALSGAFARCSRVLATVTYRVPLVAVPLLGGFGPGFTVAARHSELVDPYRSGLAGAARC